MPDDNRGKVQVYSQHSHINTYHDVDNFHVSNNGWVYFSDNKGNKVQISPTAIVIKS